MDTFVIKKTEDLAPDRAGVHILTLLLASRAALGDLLPAPPPRSPGFVISKWDNDTAAQEGVSPRREKATGLHVEGLHACGVPTARISAARDKGPGCRLC